MSDMSGQELITAAYRKGGIKDPTTQQSTDGLQDLQNMFSSWSAEGLSVPNFVTENFTLTVGQAVYTIGVTGDNPDLITATGRPIRIVDAFIRISNNDYPVSVNMTKKEYNNLLSKDTEGRPRGLYYDPQYPTGKIKFNYEADVAYDFHLISEKPLTNPSALATTMSIPLEYNLAIITNLAILLAPDDDNKLPQDIKDIAKESKESLEKYNAIDKLSDTVTLDRAITHGGGTIMDINSGD